MLVGQDHRRAAADALPAGAAGDGDDPRMLGPGQSVSAIAVGEIGWIVLHAPKVHVLTAAFPGDLQQAVAAVTDAPEIRSAVVAGTSAVFCAGADIGLADRLRGPAFGRWWLDAHHDAIAALAELPKPTVAAVNGAAAGAGWNLALACDEIVAARGVRFSQAFIGIGLATDMGSLSLLPRRIGYHRARGLMYSGRPVDAGTALEMGLVEEVAEPDELVARAKARAARLAQAPGVAFAAIKRGMSAAERSDLRGSLRIEADLQLPVLASHDFAEGTAAFLEKRQPRYTGA